MLLHPKSVHKTALHGAWSSLVLVEGVRAGLERDCLCGPVQPKLFRGCVKRKEQGPAPGAPPPLGGPAGRSGGCSRGGAGGGRWGRGCRRRRARSTRRRRRGVRTMGGGCWRLLGVLCPLLLHLGECCGADTPGLSPPGFWGRWVGAGPPAASRTLCRCPVAPRLSDPSTLVPCPEMPSKEERGLTALSGVSVLRRGQFPSSVSPAPCAHPTHLLPFPAALVQRGRRAP